MSFQKRPPVLFRAFLYLKPHALLLLAAAFSGVLRFAIPLAVPWGIKIIVDDILTKPASPAGWQTLSGLLAALFAGYLVWTAASYGRFYFTGLSGNRMIFDLRRDLYGHLQRMPLDFFETKKIGSVVSRLMHDLTLVQQVLNQGITAAAMDFVSVFVIAGVMFFIHAKLALVSVAAIPLYVWLSHFFIQKIRFSSRGVQEQVEKLSGSLFEAFSGVSLIQSFCRESSEEEKFSNRSRAHLKAVLQNIKFQALGLSLTGFLSGVIPIIILGYGAWNVLSGTLTAGELVAFYAYVGLLYMPVTRLTEMNVMIGGGLAALDRIFEFLDTVPAIQEKKFALEAVSLSGDIRFQNVFFSYPNAQGDGVFKGLDFSVCQGECIALTGISGAGKSTLVKLLLRFCDVSEGMILVGGYDIRDLTLASLRRHIAWVPQEPILLSGSILENILYGREDATAQEAIQAARAAHAHEFIVSLPQQYETPVGEKGVLLSAGEKQRIAIARAFLKNAPILILDEPSSALDEASETLIRESFKELRKGRTSLIISHRPSMLEDAGRVIHLKNGMAAEPSSALQKSFRL